MVDVLMCVVVVWFGLRGVMFVGGVVSLCGVVRCCSLLCCVMRCYVMFCFGLFCFVLLCSVLLLYVLFCSFMFCYVACSFGLCLRCDVDGVALICFGLMSEFCVGVVLVVRLMLL